MILNLIYNLPCDLSQVKIHLDITNYDLIEEKNALLEDSFFNFTTLEDCNILITTNKREIEKEYLIYIGEDYNYYLDTYKIVESYKIRQFIGYILVPQEEQDDELLLEIKEREENKEYDILPFSCDKSTLRCDYNNFLQDCCVEHIKNILSFICEHFKFNWWCDKGLLKMVLGYRGKTNDVLEIGIKSERWNEFLQLKSKFLSAGFYFKVINKPKDYVRIQISGKNEIGIDIVPRRNIKGSLYRGTTGGTKFYNEDVILQKLVDPTKEISWNDLLVKIPNCEQEVVDLRFDRLEDKTWNFDVNSLIIPKRIEVIDELPQNVFLYWEGKRNEIIDKCERIIEERCINFDIIKVDDNNINEYIEIPSYVLEKRNPKIKSLFIKCALLNKYGGTWIDSDLVLMKNLETIIEPLKKYDFIGYGYYYGEVEDAFMSCRKNCLLVDLWFRRFKMLFKKNQLNYKNLNFVFNEVSDNYKYYNYNYNTFEPFEDLSRYSHQDNGFVEKVIENNLINGFHLHGEVTKREITRGSILSKLLGE